MSPLTKILIVLLTVSSILLCGVVVSYVASADDFREKYKDANDDLMAAEEMTEQAQEEYKTAKAQFEQQERNLSQRLNTANSDLSEAKLEVGRLKAENTRLFDEASKWKETTNTFTTTNENQRKMLLDTQAQLEAARAEVIKLKKQLDETSNTLIDKLAILDDLQRKIDQLKDEKAELLAKVNEPLKTVGKEVPVAVPVKPVAMEAAAPAIAVAVPKDINLKALVTAVDMQGSMAGLSVGAADGVKKGMRFHIIRGSDFVCDVVVIDVDMEQSVGRLEYVTAQPNVGDSAATNFDI